MNQPFEELGKEHMAERCASGRMASRKRLGAFEDQEGSLLDMVSEGNYDTGVSRRVRRLPSHAGSQG